MHFVKCAWPYCWLKVSAVVGEGKKLAYRKRYFLCQMDTHKSVSKKKRCRCTQIILSESSLNLLMDFWETFTYMSTLCTLFYVITNFFSKILFAIVIRWGNAGPLLDWSFLVIQKIKSSDIGATWIQWFESGQKQARFRLQIAYTLYDNSSFIIRREMLYCCNFQQS